MCIITGQIQKAPLRDYNGALADYNTTIRMSPKNAEAIFYRGNIKTDIRDYKGAISDYKKAAEMKPDLPNLYLLSCRSCQ